MMPLSLPRYTFLSEFIGAERAGRLEETAAISLQRTQSKKEKKIPSSGPREGEGGRKTAFPKTKGRGKILCSLVHLSGAGKVILQTFLIPPSGYTRDGVLQRSEVHGDRVGDISMRAHWSRLFWRCCCCCGCQPELTLLISHNRSCGPELWSPHSARH